MRDDAPNEPGRLPPEPEAYLRLMVGARTASTFSSDIALPRTGAGPGRRDWQALDGLMRDHLAPHFAVESLVTGVTYRGAAGLRELVDDIQQQEPWRR